MSAYIQVQNRNRENSAQSILHIFQTGSDPKSETPARKPGLFSAAVRLTIRRHLCIPQSSAPLPPPTRHPGYVRLPKTKKKSPHPVVVLTATPL